MNDSNVGIVESLGMVRDELVVAIDEAALNLETYVSGSDPKSVSSNLQACIDGIQQIAGILNMIQLQGADVLAQELLSSATEIVPGESSARTDQSLEQISNSFFVLPRYLEYVTQTKQSMPILLIPYINTLRKARGEQPFPESFFFSVNIKASPELPAVAPYDFGDQPVRQELRRLRHMYQIGLLGYVTDRQIKNSLLMMRRALLRLQRISGQDKPMTLFWWLANVAVNVMSEVEMEVNLSRKQLFMRLDKMFRQVELNHAEAFAAAPPAVLLKELVYLITLSGIDTEEVTHIRRAFAVAPLPFTDKDLVREADSLKGPSAQTLSSLVKLLQSELLGVKTTLEQASLTSDCIIDDVNAFIEALSKVTEILSVVGLPEAGQALTKVVDRAKTWQANKPIDEKDLQEVANTLLYVESAVYRLETNKHGDLDEGSSELEHDKVIADAELTSSQTLAIEESQSGLLLVKRALSAFMDSEYDSGHIRNINKTLNSVRGAMAILGKLRAANILILCVAFVEDVLMEQEPQPAMREMLETFADAIIALEYYLNSAVGAGDLNDSVLKFAEESLSALGYQAEEQLTGQ